MSGYRASIPSMGTAPVTGESLNAKGVEIWAQYAKERFDAGEKRLTDFRNWARQLAAAAGVVVGLEAALLGQVVKLADISGLAQGVCLILLLGTVAVQIVILGRAVAAGYVGKELLLAESPVVLAGHLDGKDEVWTRQTIGAYYAKSSDTVHAAAEAVAKEVGSLARAFRSSLWLLFAAMVLTACTQATVSRMRKPMADTPSSPGTGSSDTGSSPVPSAPASLPSPSAPAASPLLVTPTPGASETRSLPSPRQTLLSTPTVGQRLTESTSRKK